MPRISILIVNYNSGARLRRCLASLQKQTNKDFEVVVIDNGSLDDSISQAISLVTDFRLIEAGENLGFAAANNRAAETCQSEWLVFLNPDAYPEPGWIDALLSAASRYEWADAFGSTQLQAEEPMLLDGAGDVYTVFGLIYRGLHGRRADNLPMSDGECFAPCAAAAMYRRTAFEGLGGFDEQFFCYGEDLDLGFRLRLSGGRCVQLREAVILHEGSAISGRVSDFTVYHGTRNRIWLSYKNIPVELFALMIPLQFLTNLVFGLRFIPAGKFLTYCRALIDGYTGYPGLRNQRKAVQARRKLSVLELMKIIAWSPHYPILRKAKLKSLS